MENDLAQGGVSSLLYVNIDLENYLVRGGVFSLLYVNMDIKEGLKCLFRVVYTQYHYRTAIRTLVLFVLLPWHQPVGVFAPGVYCNKEILSHVMPGTTCLFSSEFGAARSARRKTFVGERKETLDGIGANLNDWNAVVNPKMLSMICIFVVYCAVPKHTVRFFSRQNLFFQESSFALICIQNNFSK